MLDRLSWLALRAELAAWAHAGRRPALWWRDDDARRPTAALARLSALSERHAWPLLLAIVPDDDVDGLSACLAKSRSFVPGQHGATHANHAQPGEPPAEIPAGESLDVAVARLAPAAARMRAAGLAPRAYVPPWNRIESPTPEAAAAVGCLHLSGFGEPASIGCGLPRLDAHVDVLRWGGGARFRGAARVFDRLRRLLEARRTAAAWDEPIGLLTHHLDHDAATWSFLEAFLPKARRHFDLLSPEDAFARVVRTRPSMAGSPVAAEP